MRLGTRVSTTTLEHENAEDGGKVEDRKASGGAQSLIQPYGGRLVDLSLSDDALSGLLADGQVSRAMARP